MVRRYYMHREHLNWWTKKRVDRRTFLRSSPRPPNATSPWTLYCITTKSSLSVRKLQPRTYTANLLVERLSYMRFNLPLAALLLYALNAQPVTSAGRNQKLCVCQLLTTFFSRGGQGWHLLAEAYRQLLLCKLQQDTMGVSHIEWALKQFKTDVHISKTAASETETK
jgi:hypothetical protein